MNKVFNHYNFIILKTRCVYGSVNDISKIVFVFISFNHDINHCNFVLHSQMFPWSAVFSLEPKVPGQRSTEELVTNTLMLELGAMVKRTERIRLERATEGRRRRRSSSSTADYSWLANNPTPQSYELTPNDLLELQDLCGKIPPVKCGPLIVR